jgi:hypothetical protein
MTATTTLLRDLSPGRGETRAIRRASANWNSIARRPCQGTRASSATSVFCRIAARHSVFGAQEFRLPKFSGNWLACVCHRCKISRCAPPKRGDRGRILRNTLIITLLYILALRDDPKIVGRDDAEVVSDSVAEELPMLRYCRSEELQDSSPEVSEGGVVPVVGDVMMHRAQHRSIGARCGQ